MTPFTKVRSVAAPLPETDIDTDIIFPARFLLLLDRRGLGAHLFHERRRGGGPTPFVLDRAPFDRAQILVAGRNFGCGSSREHAVWALSDFGVRAIVAPSFGEIFYANCFRNGVLPVRLDGAPHEQVMAAAETGAPIEIELTSQIIRLPGGEDIPFEIESGRRRDLMMGRDEIDAILAGDIADIQDYEAHRLARRGWLELGPEQFAALKLDPRRQEE